MLRRFARFGVSKRIGKCGVERPPRRKSSSDLRSLHECKLALLLLVYISEGIVSFK